MRNRAITTVLVVLAVIAAGCSAAETDSAALDAATAERDGLIVERDQLAQQLGDLEGEMSALRVQVEDLDAAYQAQSVALASAEDETTAAQATATEAELKAVDAVAAANAEVEALRLKYDPEIRAELQTTYDAEMNRACEQAKVEWETPVVALVQWDSQWESISTTNALIEAVEECSSAERSKTAEDREADRLAACEAVDVDALEKDPDAYNGTCIHMWARITQYDSNTGVCTFRAEMSDRKATRWYDYDGNAIMVSPTDPSCPELDGIDTDDFVEVWATGNGTLTYDTTIGGSATATLWLLEAVRLIKKD